MATFYPKKSAWLKQPHYPVGLSSEWAPKIVFASLVGQTWNYDLKTKISPSVVGTGLSRTVRQQGQATIASDDTSGLFWSGLTPIANGNNGYAMLFYGAPVSQAEADRAIVLGNEAASNYNQMTFAFNSDKDAAATAGKFAIFEYNSAFANRADSTASQVDGNYHVFIANRAPGSAGQTRLYRDGLDVTGTQTHAAGVACTAGTSILCSPVSTSAGFEHPASFAVVFNAPLSSADISRLSANPWLVLQKQSRHIWVPVAAGGAGVASGDGVSTGSVVGASTNSQAASGTGVATGSAVGASVNRQAASGDGVATGSAVGASIAASTASGTGVATGAAVGSSAVAGQGVASGDGVATGSAVGASIAAAVATGNGVATGGFVSQSTGAAMYSGGYESNFVDYGENARKRRELEEIEEPQTQDVEIIEVKPVSQTKPPIKKRQDRPESTLKLEQENAQLKALQIERDNEIKRLMLLEQQIRQEDEEILILYAATLRQPMQIAA